MATSGRRAPSLVGDLLVVGVAIALVVLLAVAAFTFQQQFAVVEAVARRFLVPAFG